MTEELQYCKVRKVKSPNRAHPSDAGIDFYVPEDISAKEFNEKCSVTNDKVEFTATSDGKVKEIILRPGQSVLIPSGIKVKVPDGYALIYTNKSGVASKKHLMVGANTVDIGYEGECHLNLHNVGTQIQTINAGDKIVQGIMFKLGFHEPKEVVEDQLYDSASTRGAGGFGSTGTN